MYYATMLCDGIYTLSPKSMDTSRNPTSSFCSPADLGIKVPLGIRPLTSISKWWCPERSLRLRLQTAISMSNTRDSSRKAITSKREVTHFQHLSLQHLFPTAAPPPPTQNPGMVPIQSTANSRHAMESSRLSWPAVLPGTFLCCTSMPSFSRQRFCNERPPSVRTPV